MRPRRQTKAPEFPDKAAAPPRRSRTKPGLWQLLPELTPRTIDALPDITEFFFAPRSPARGHYWGAPDRTAPGAAAGLGREALRYAAIFEIYKRLNVVPGFGDFAHSPKYRGNGETRELRLELGAAPDIARLRAGVDLFLYSPGCRKRLVLCPGTAGRPAAAAAEALEEIALYAMLKAGSLKKRLAIEAGTAGRARRDAA